MQTFLPYSSFEDSAKCLDKKRLFKQVVEAKQILCTLRYTGVPYEWRKSKSWINRKWKNHPAVKMWEGYEPFLSIYYDVFLKESKNRGVNTSMEFIYEKGSTASKLIDYIELIWWIKNDKFHNSMKARLFNKDSNFYSIFEEYKDFNKGKYLWPDNDNKIYKVI